MNIGYLGNFEPEHSTENHVAQALERGLRIGVRRYQENETDILRQVGAEIQSGDIDLLLWTRTWPVDKDMALWMLAVARAAGVPTVGFHLDRWWGLNREDQIQSEPFFVCDLVITADGGHEREWDEYGINHLWLPPAVSEFECQPGMADEAYASDVAFVGSWLPGYHEEWPHRYQMIAYLESWYGDRFTCWPKPGQPALRGEPLRNLYASTKVNVGDSCMVGDGGRYWSDRIPETLGRGGFLLHPDTPGLSDHFSPVHHLPTWTLGDWDELHEAIDFYLHPANQDTRAQVAAEGRAHVLEHHTYTVRCRQMLEAAQSL